MKKQKAFNINKFSINIEFVFLCVITLFLVTTLYQLIFTQLSEIEELSKQLDFYAWLIIALIIVNTRGK